METKLKLTVCKICLKTSCPLYRIRALGLEDTYTTLSGLPLDIDVWPQTVCTVCAIQLRNSRQLAAKSKWAHKLLSDLYARKPMITLDDVRKIDCSSILESPNFDTAVFTPNHCDLHINEEDILSSAQNIVKWENAKDHNYSFNHDDEKLKKDLLIEHVKEKVESGPESDQEFSESLDYGENPNETDKEEKKVYLENCVVFEVKPKENDDKAKLVRKPELIPISNDKAKLVQKPERRSNLKARSAKQLRARVTKPHSRPLKTLKTLKVGHAVDTEKEESPSIDADEKQETSLCATRPKNETMILKGTFNIRKRSLEEQRLELEKMKLKAIYVNSPYKCEPCSRGFKVQAHYTAHMELHSETSGIFECSLCHLRFPTWKRRERHVLKHETYYACKKCSYKTLRKGNAIHHHKWHRGISYKCETCPGVEFEFISSLIRHQRLYHPSPVSCALCGRGFLDEKGLHKHFEWKHPGQPVRIPEDGLGCQKCELTFASADALATHQIAQHGGIDSQVSTLSRKQGKQGRHIGKPKKYKCDECPKAFVLRCHYTLHMQRAHDRTVSLPPEEKKKQKLLRHIQCDVCGKLFTCQAMLRYHADEHNESVFHACEVCGKRFKTRVHLQLHERRHRSQYACPICHKSFNNSGNRDRHQKNVHKTEKDVVCQFCSKGFKSKEERRSHTLYVHLKKPWPTRSRNRKRTAEPVARVRRTEEMSEDAK